MNNLKNLLFSSYQRTTMIILLAVLAIAIPLTLILVSEQQDIRQRAAELDDSVTTRGAISQEKIRSFCNDCLSKGLDFACGTLRGGKLRIECKKEKKSSFGLCISCKDLATPTPGSSPTATASPTSSPSTTPITTPTPIPQPEFHDVIDFNDDGKIDELDLNILYSGFSRRKGD